MKTPGFWYRRPGLAAYALSPLGWLYGWLTKRRLAGGAYHELEVPVICVGNLNAGGTGKTPTVIAVVEALRAIGHVPHVVTRGYGGVVQGPMSVEPAKHSTYQVGDEPLLLAAFADVWVAKDRKSGAIAAQDQGASVIVLDDGFQNPALHQDLKLVVVNAKHGFGNGFCIPAGPLREPAARGLARADAVITIGAAEAHAQFQDMGSLPRLNAQLAPLRTGMDWTGTRVLAFAGIAHPEAFFETLRHLGAQIVHEEPLGDHEPLTAAFLSRLETRAAQLGAQLVTTEKDAARLPKDWIGRVLSVPVRLRFDPETELATFLHKRLGRGPH